MFNNLKKMITSENMLILKSLVVIGLVLFFTVGRSKENYRNINTYWEEKAFRLPFDSKKKKKDAKREVKNAPNQKRKYQQVRRNLLIALIRTEKAQEKSGKSESTKLTKLNAKLKKLNAKLNK